MAEHIAVIVIVAISAALAMGIIYRAFTGKSSGCSCSKDRCATRSACDSKRAGRERDGMQD